MSLRNLSIAKDQKPSVKFLIGPRLSLLAQIKGISQTAIADQCGISRITINRFFTGKTELRSRDLIQVLELLGVSVEAQLNQMLERSMQGVQAEEDEDTVIQDVSLILSGVGKRVQKTLLSQIQWWGRSAHSQQTRQAVNRLQVHLERQGLALQ